MVVVVGDGVQRTFIQSVNNIITAIGEAAAATLINPSRRVEIAMRGVIKARDRVYYKSAWEFRRGHFRIELENDQMWYELPSDYHKMKTGISRNTQAQTLNMFTYEQLMEQNPDLRAFPPGSAVSDLVTILQLASQDHNFGAPELYVIVDQYIGLYPIPDEDFVTLEGSLYSTYTKHAPLLASDNDDVGLPRNLWGCMDLLASSYLKRALEFTDWVADQQMGEDELSQESSGRKEYKDNTNEFDPLINYNE